jgi:hypothetical protein
LMRGWRDPESRNIAENEIMLDPGWHLAPLDLAGMTNYAAEPSGVPLSQTNENQPPPMGGNMESASPSLSTLSLLA